MLVLLQFLLWEALLVGQYAPNVGVLVRERIVKLNKVDLVLEDGPQGIHHSFLVHSFPLRSEIGQVMIVFHYFALERVLFIEGKSLDVTMKLRSIRYGFLFVAEKVNALLDFDRVLGPRELLFGHPFEIRVGSLEVHHQSTPLLRCILLITLIHNLIQCISSPRMEFVRKVSEVRLCKTILVLYEVLNLAEVLLILRLQLDVAHVSGVEAQVLEVLVLNGVELGVVEPFHGVAGPEEAKTLQLNTFDAEVVV